MKIRIIGGSGSGKTYLATQLAQKYHIPHYDLDNLQWDNRAKCYGVKRDKQKRADMLQEILKQDDWIMEGVYYTWCEQSFAEADQIYLLEVPHGIYTYRIWKRFLKRKLGLEQGKRETWKSVCGLIRWTNQYCRKDMLEIKKMLEPYESKLFESDFRKIK